MYAAIIRFICQNRDLSDFSLVIDRVAGRSLHSSGGDPSSPSSPFAGGARRARHRIGETLSDQAPGTGTNREPGRARNQPGTRSGIKGNEGREPARKPRKTNRR